MHRAQFYFNQSLSRKGGTLGCHANSTIQCFGDENAFVWDEATQAFGCPAQDPFPAVGKAPPVCLLYGLQELCESTAGYHFIPVDPSVLDTSQFPPSLFVRFPFTVVFLLILLTPTIRATVPVNDVTIRTCT